jgi:hypothetical protein
MAIRDNMVEIIPVGEVHDVLVTGGLPSLDVGLGRGHRGGLSEKRA